VDDGNVPLDVLAEGVTGYIDRARA
jgi:hypothetical protein